MNNNPTDKDTIVYVPISVDKELPTEEGYYRTIGGIMSSYFHLDKGEKGMFEWAGQITHWLKPVPLSVLVEEKVKELKRNIFVLRTDMETILSESKEPITKAVAQSALDETKTIIEPQSKNSFCKKHKWYGMPEEQCPQCNNKIKTP